MCLMKKIVEGMDVLIFSILSDASDLSFQESVKSVTEIPPTELGRFDIRILFPFGFKDYFFICQTFIIY